MGLEKSKNTLKYLEYCWNCKKTTETEQTKENNIPHCNLCGYPKRVKAIVKPKRILIENIIFSIIMALTLIGVITLVKFVVEQILSLIK